MKHYCIGCKKVMPLRWHHDKCSSCFRVTGEWTENEYWANIANFGYALDHYGYSSDTTSSKHTIFKPPVWY